MIETDDLAEDSVIVMIGTGLSQWLLQDSEINAASHAVRSELESSSFRTVMARMKVASSCNIFILWNS